MEPVTPTGVLIGDFAPGSLAWHEQRRTGIGSSDIPKLVGSSKWGDPLSIYYEKRGDLAPDEGGEAALWGTLLEPVIAAEYARRHGVGVAKVGTIAHSGEPWMLANLDFLVTGCPLAPKWPADGPPLCALEVKNRNAWVTTSWREAPPDDVLAQVQWQLAVSGLDHIHAAGLLGGNELISHLVTPEPEVIEYVVSEARKVWDAVRSGTPPKVTPSEATIRVLNRLHPDRSGETELPTEAVALIEKYETSRVQAKRLDDEMTAAKAALLELLGDASEGLIHGDTAVTYRKSRYRSCDYDLLKAEHPDAYAAAVRQKPTHRFHITRQFRYPEGEE